MHPGAGAAASQRIRRRFAEASGGNRVWGFRTLGHAADEVSGPGHAEFLATIGPLTGSRSPRRSRNHSLVRGAVPGTGRPKSKHDIDVRRRSSQAREFLYMTLDLVIAHGQVRDRFGAVEITFVRSPSCASPGLRRRRASAATGGDALALVGRIPLVRRHPRAVRGDADRSNSGRSISTRASPK